MVMEVYNPDLSEAMKYYHSGADMPFNFNLIDVDQDRDARWFHEQIQKWMASMPKGKWPCFVVRNHVRSIHCVVNRSEVQALVHSLKGCRRLFEVGGTWQIVDLFTVFIYSGHFTLSRKV